MPKESPSLWSEEKLQKEIKKELKQIFKKSNPWFILLLAPSCMLGIDKSNKKQNILITQEHLWGTTPENYGEKVAEFLIKNSGDRLAKGIIFRMLKEYPELKTKVLKALLKEVVDKESLENQHLFERSTL